MNSLEEMIKLAKINHACDEHIEKLSQYKTIEEALEDEEAPYWCYWYSYFVLKARWPEMEWKILESSEWAFCYAADIIKGRWPEAEDVIMQSMEYSYYYAKRILKTRWLKVEPYILVDAFWARLYKRHFSL